MRALLGKGGGGNYGNQCSGLSWSFGYSRYGTLASTPVFKFCFDVCRGCTDGNPRKPGGSETKALAPSGTERHPRPKLDQARDQETKPILVTGSREAAERLLRAVADGAVESVELAMGLVSAVLVDDLAKRAMELDRLSKESSPLALVRAVTQNGR